jgi:SAM-dependent methyltransferase
MTGDLQLIEKRSLGAPWWGIIAAKVVLSRLPLGYGVWRRLGLFRHGEMDRSEYAIGVFDAHANKADFTGRMQGKTILELGPGDSIATAIIAASYGAKALLVDAGRFVQSDVRSFLALQMTLRDRGLRPPDLSHCRDVDEVLGRCHARYLTDGLRSLKTIEDQSVDMIFSQAVLEHIWMGEFVDMMRECRRILKPGGICSHEVDLRDHLGGALNHLRFSAPVWESGFLAKSGFYTNRIRYNQMLELFRQTGFLVEVIAVQRWAECPTPRRRLAREFRELQDEELCVSVFEVLLR